MFSLDIDIWIWCILGAAIVCAVIAYGILFTPLGRVCDYIKDNEPDTEPESASESESAAEPKAAEEAAEEAAQKTPPMMRWRCISKRWSVRIIPILTCSLS
jgi:hypothetical protein